MDDRPGTPPAGAPPRPRRLVFCLALVGACAGAALAAATVGLSYYFMAPPNVGVSVRIPGTGTSFAPIGPSSAATAAAVAWGLRLAMVLAGAACGAVAGELVCWAGGLFGRRGR